MTVSTSPKDGLLQAGETMGVGRLTARSREAGIWLGLSPPMCWRVLRSCNVSVWPAAAEEQTEQTALHIQPKAFSFRRRTEDSRNRKGRRALQPLLKERKGHDKTQ